jgi:hypothetical protein
MGVMTAGERLIYMNAREKLIDQMAEDSSRQAAENAVAKAVLTQSYLRTEQPLIVGQTNIQFPLVVNQQPNGNFNTQNLLALQDSFVIAQLGVFLFVPASATDTTVALLSYPNLIQFTVAGAAASAETVYHSYLTLSVNKKVIVPFWDVFRSRLANETQQTAPPGPGSPLDQLSGRDDVLYPTEPNWVIIGSRSSILSLIMPVQIATAQPNARIVILARGVLAQNSTSVN